jgi:hypothetical protein
MPIDIIICGKGNQPSNAAVTVEPEAHASGVEADT